MSINNKNWLDKLKLVKEYKIIYGEFPSYGTSLGDWLQRQRKLYLANKLSLDRLEQLKNIGYELHSPSKLKKMRISRKISLEELSEYTSLGKAMIKKLEQLSPSARNIENTKVTHLFKIIELLECSYEEVLEDSYLQKVRNEIEKNKKDFNKK